MPNAYCTANAAMVVSADPDDIPSFRGTKDFQAKTPLPGKRAT
jgi:hypothetical protein